MTTVKDKKRRLFEVYDNDELKKKYIEAAIDTYKLTHLQAYLNRGGDIVINKDGAILGGFLFIPAYTLKAYLLRQQESGETAEDTRRRFENFDKN